MKNEILEQLKKYCSQCNLKIVIHNTKNTLPNFTIKIKNQHSKNFALVLSKNIVNLNEDYFYAISTCRKNDTILFSFFGLKEKESTFFSNLLNFIKIIYLNNIHNCEINLLEELISAKMLQSANDNIITYIISEKMLIINNQHFDLQTGIKKLNNKQIDANNNFKFNLQEFCKSCKVTNKSLKKISQIVN